MTKKTLLFIVCICLALFAVAQKKSKGGAKVNWKKVNVLVYIKNGNGYVHENRAAGVAAIKQLGTQHGFSVTVSENPADFNETNLKQYNLVVFNNTNNEVFDTDEQKWLSCAMCRQAADLWASTRQQARKEIGPGLKD